MYIIGLDLPKKFTYLKDTIGYKYVEYLYAHLTIKALDDMLGEHSNVPNVIKEKLTDDVSQALINSENFHLTKGSVQILTTLNYEKTQPQERGFNVDNIISSTLEFLIEELHEQPNMSEIGEQLASTEVVQRLNLYRLFLNRTNNTTELVRYALNHARKDMYELLKR